MSDSAYRDCGFPWQGLRGPSRRAGLVDSTNNALVDAIGLRCPDAIAEIYRRHSGAVSARAAYLLPELASADDVVQEVFFRLWGSPERFNPSRGSLRAYLLTDTHGRAVDLLRSEICRRRQTVDISRNVDLVAGCDLDAEGRLDAARIRAAMTQLPTPERRAIELAYFTGYTYREVARRLGVPEGTGKARIRSGLRRLSLSLADLDVALGQ